MESHVHVPANSSAQPATIKIMYAHVLFHTPKTKVIMAASPNATAMKMLSGLLG